MEARGGTGLCGQDGNGQVPTVGTMSHAAIRTTYPVTRTDLALETMVIVGCCRSVGRVGSGICAAEEMARELSWWGAGFKIARVARPGTATG